MVYWALGFVEEFLRSVRAPIPSRAEGVNAYRVLPAFIQCKTGWLGCDFEQHAARLAEVNGMKIRAIDYWRDVVAKIDQMFAPLELFGLVLCAKGNVMH